MESTLYYSTNVISSIYETRLFVCFILFCNYEIHQTEMLQIMLLVSLESFQGKGVHWLSFMVFGVVV